MYNHIFQVQTAVNKIFSRLESTVRSESWGGTGTKQIHGFNCRDCWEGLG